MTTKERIIEAIVSAGEISVEEARTVADGYIKSGCIKIDKHNGGWTLAHGNFMLKDNIRFALHTLQVRKGY